MKSLVFALALLPLLQACKTAPIVSPPVQVACPKPPPLAKVPLGPSFLDRTQEWLSGKLPAPID